MTAVPAWRTSLIRRIHLIALAMLGLGGLCPLLPA
jgi:hypothetical protein